MVTARVKAAGGIVLGKTNTSHYGYKDMCDNLIGPPCRNPWQLEADLGGFERWCRGCRGGRAWSLGAWLRRGRVDSHPRGALWGFWLKPSFGRSRTGLTLTSARHIPNGPITRTVADAALLLGVMAGPDPRDPTSIDSPPEDYLAAVAHPLEALRGLRVAWSMDFGYAPVDPEVRRLTAAAAERFQSFGCEVEAVNPDWDNPREPASVMWYVCTPHAWVSARISVPSGSSPVWPR